MCEGFVFHTVLYDVVLCIIPSVTIIPPKQCRIDLRNGFVQNGLIECIYSAALCRNKLSFITKSKAI